MNKQSDWFTITRVSSFCKKRIFLRLLEKHNTLQLPFSAFFFWSFSATCFWNIEKFGTKKYFTDQRIANAILLFLAIIEKISGLLFFWTSHRNEGQFARDYLINTFYLHTLKKTLRSGQKSQVTWRQQSK